MKKNILVYSIVIIAILVIAVFVYGLYHMPKDFRPEVKINLSNEALGTQDYFNLEERLIDLNRLEKVSAWPPYPKRAFIGETYFDCQTVGWYVLITGPNEISRPYVGYMTIGFRFEIPTQKTY